MSPGEFLPVLLPFYFSRRPLAKKDLSSGNIEANANTEIVMVASLSGTFEGRCTFYVLCHACLAFDGSVTVSRISNSEGGRMITASSLQSPLVTSKVPATGTASLPLHAPTSTSPRIKQILDAALSGYKKRTGTDLLDSLLARELQSCDSVEDVLDIIRHQAEAFDKFRDGDERLMTWIGSSVDALYKISSILDEAVGMVCTICDHLRFVITLLCRRSPLRKQSLLGLLSSSLFVHLCSFCELFFNADFSQSAKDIQRNYDALVDLFERIQSLLKHLPNQISPTEEIVDILVIIVAEVLSILSIATKEIKRGRASKLFLQDVLD